MIFFPDTPITSKEDSSLQYFWEAFPAGSGKSDRTTYLFTYMDAKNERPSIAEVRTILVQKYVPNIVFQFLAVQNSCICCIYGEMKFLLMQPALYL